MILTTILNFLFLFLEAVINLLPQGGLPVVIGSAFSYFIGVINTFSYVVPIGTLLSAVAVVAAFDGALLLWGFINWIVRKIPGMQ